MRRFWIGASAALVGAAVALLAAPSRAALGTFFKLSPSAGFIVLNDVIMSPGHHLVSRFNGKRASKCIDGTAEDAFCRQYIENDATGDAFIDYASNSYWRFATKSDGTYTDLTGNVDPTGQFMMAGTHALSGAHLFFVGKAKFAKGTTNPVSLSGTLYFTSPTIQEFGQTTFKSVK